MKKIVSLILVIIAFQTAKAQQTAPTDTNKPFIIVQQMPIFPGGQDSLRSYLQKNTIYPKSALDKKLGGTVYVSFVVSATGTIVDATILRGIPNAPELDAEALRVVKAMPNWIPGVQKGKNVSVHYNLPMRFTLPKN